MLELCRKHLITINRKKFLFGQREVEFAGFILSKDGVKADPKKLDPIKKFHQPTNITEMRSFI